MVPQKACCEEMSRAGRTWRMDLAEAAWRPGACVWAQLIGKSPSESFGKVTYRGNFNLSSGNSSY